jgi:aryl-alcohol dehydrogenase-like predicted oxidoreductase
MEAGGNFIDTAGVYSRWAPGNTGGESETALGIWMSARRNRHAVVMATKVCGPMGPGPNDKGLSRQHIVHGVEASLRRLQTDYIDLYQAHWDDRDTPLEETLRAFDDLVRQGKVLYVGVSEWRAEEIARAIEIATDMGFDRLVSNQPQYSMLWRVIESEVVPLSEKEGISQIVWSPIAQGVLTGKYLPGQPPPEGSRATDETGSGFISGFLRDEVLEKVQQLVPLAREAGLSMAQLAVAWVLQNPNVASAIVGASRPEQVHDNAGAVGVRLDDDLLRAIDDVLEGVVVTDPARTKSPATRP